MSEHEEKIPLPQFKAVVESFRSDLKTFAEVVVSRLDKHDVKLDALTEQVGHLTVEQAALKYGQERLQAGQTRLEAGQEEIKTELRQLAENHVQMQSRVETIERKLA